VLYILFYVHIIYYIHFRSTGGGVCSEIGGGVGGILYSGVGGDITVQAAWRHRQRKTYYDIFNIA